MLRRYAVGVDGPVWFFSDARWEPPVPALVLVLGYTVVIAATMWWIVLAPAGLLRRRDPSTPRLSGLPARPPDVIDREAPVGA